MSSSQPSWYTRFACGGAAACVAETATIAFDTAKVRLQIKGSGAGAGIHGHGLFGMVMHIAKTEGPLALFKGLTPGLQRQLLFGTLRLGLYEPIKGFFSGGDGAVSGFGAKAGAGLLAGAIGILVANPTDVVKVRLQAQLRSTNNEPARYKGSIDAYRLIVREEGWRGLYRGLVPNLLRNSFMNMAELATYDTVKETLIHTLGYADGTIIHMGSATVCAMVATSIGSPIDVMKTRIMNSDLAGHTGVKYNGVVDCATQTFKKEGFLAFYKGASAQFVRIASWNIVMFVTFERFKKIAGL